MSIPKIIVFCGLLTACASLPNESYIEEKGYRWYPAFPRAKHVVWIQYYWKDFEEVCPAWDTFHFGIKFHHVPIACVKRDILDGICFIYTKYIKYELSEEEREHEEEYHCKRGWDHLPPL